MPRGGRRVRARGRHGSRVHGEARNTGVLRSIAGLGRACRRRGRSSPTERSRPRSRRAPSAWCWDPGRSTIWLSRPPIERLGERLVVGIEVERAIASVRAGAGAPTSRSSRRWMAGHASGAARCLITGVARVSSLTGPDVHALALAVRLGLPAIAAGGVASMDDLVALRDAGAEARWWAAPRSRVASTCGGGSRRSARSRRGRRPLDSTAHGLPHRPRRRGRRELERHAARRLAAARRALAVPPAARLRRARCEQAAAAVIAEVKRASPDRRRDRRRGPARTGARVRRGGRGRDLRADRAAALRRVARRPAAARDGVRGSRCCARTS